MNVIDYPQVNWLREWFLDAKTEVKPFFTRKSSEYVQFLHEVFTELWRVLRAAGTCVFEVGSDKLCEMVLAASSDYFEAVDVLVNKFEGKHVSKISRAMTGGQETATTENRCVILRPLRGSV